MAVAVSQEWIDNQKSAIRRPGFIVIDLPDVKLHYGRLSHYLLKDFGYVYYGTDSVGCDYIDRCEIIVHFDTELLGDRTIYIRTLNTKGFEMEFVSLSPENLDSQGRYVWETKGFDSVNIKCYGDDYHVTDVKGLIDIEMNVYGIPRADITSYEHSRSYDPVGFELPTNHISIDIYNYENRYTDFYKSYADEQYKLNVKYGYNLENGDEIIQGGVFTLSDVQLSNNVLTLTGENVLEFVNDKLTLDLFTLKANENGCIHIPVSEIGKLGVESIDLRDREELSITANDIISYLQNTANIPINTTSVFSNKVLETSVNANCIEAVQSLITLLLARCFIDREDILHYDECLSTSVSEGNHILMTNCLEKPTYTSTKKLKKFEVSKTGTGKAETVSESTEMTGTYDKDYATGRVMVDCVNNKLLSVDMSWYHGVSAMHYLDIYPDKVEMYYRYNTGTVGADVEYVPKIDIVEERIVSNNGAICDISSPFGEPSDYNKIVKYFSNRELYTFKVRGNPARDVGDYIDVSLVNDDDITTYKKGLVLSSTLTYDGSFKEEVEVRIIETEFEGETTE